MCETYLQVNYQTLRVYITDRRFLIEQGVQEQKRNGEWDVGERRNKRGAHRSAA